MAGRIIKFHCELITSLQVQNGEIKRLHVIFDGQNKPLVSDHYGLEAELSL